MDDTGPNIFTPDQIDWHLLKDLYTLEEAELLNNKPLNAQAMGRMPEQGSLSVFQCELSLTEEGKRLADRVVQGRRAMFRPTRPYRTTIFVACAFGREEIDQFYKERLEPICTTAGYVPKRVDLVEPSQTIMNEILEGINAAECILADLTFARPSVYFEIGIAFGLGIHPILTCRSDYEKSQDDYLKVHFDLAQFKISYWSRNADGVFSWTNDLGPGPRLKTVLQQNASKIQT